MKKIVLFLFVFTVSTILYSQTNFQNVDADDPLIHYTGRFDHSNPKAVKFSYPGVSISFAFKGKVCNIRLKDISGGNDPAGNPMRNFYNIIIDGRKPFVLEANLFKEIYIIDTLSASSHTLEIFKRTEALVGDGVFLGFQIEKGGRLEKQNLNSKKLKMEFIGNSITCGYGNEGPDKDCGFSAETENNYLAYGALTARKLNAEYVAVAYSGKGIYQNYDKTREETMPELYLRILPHDKNSRWDFKKWQPDIVVVNLGTNDFAHTNPDSVIWVKKYVTFIKTIRKNYPYARIICCLGPMVSDGWPVGNKALTTLNNYLHSIYKVLKNEGENKLYLFQFEQHKDNYGCDWHPGLKTHERMSEELKKFIESEALINPSIKK